MMRARASQPAPRLPVSRFLAGWRICADPFRRAVPTLALAFLASLLALGFRGSNFAQLSLSIALGPANPPAAGAGNPTAPHRDAPLSRSTSGTRYEVLPQRRFQSEQTSLRLPEQAEEVGRGGDDETTAQADSGSDAAVVGSSVKAQDVKDRGPTVRGIEISSNPGTDGIYAAAEEILVTVTFSRVVEVTGVLELELRVGTEVKQALYRSGAGTSELVFTYQVAEGDVDTDGMSIEAGSLLLDEGAIGDPAGNAALPDHEGLEADPRHRVDGVGPVLVGEEAELDGDRLILPFAEALDETSTPRADDFRVTVAGESREVSEVAVKGSEVRLTLVSPAEAGEAAAVSYEVAPESAGKPVRDQAGNPAEGFTDQAVVNRTGGALPARAVRQIQAILEAKQKRTPAQRKVDSQLLEEWQKAQGRPGADRMVTVDLRAEVTPEVLERIRELGGTVLNSVERYQAIRAELPLSEVEALAAHDGVRSIRTADKAVTRDRPRKLPPDILIDVLKAGSRTSQGDVAHQANTARTTHGVDGTGIGIGVLSNGVRSLAARQATGDLPARVTVLAGQEGREGDEGTAMLEIVHDLAPGAELYFATAFGGMASFAENIEALCEAGADVIVDDVYYFVEGPFQDDIIAQGVNAAVDDGCFYFSAGGNAGNKNDGTAGVWEGDFAAGSPLVLNDVNVGVQHDFGSGLTQNRITEDSPGAYILWWADPLEGSSNDYDLFLVDQNGDVLESSTRIQDGTRDPYEYIDSSEEDHTDARLVIVKTSGAEDRHLRLDTLEGQLAVSTAGSLFGHAAAEKAISVAAVAVRSAGGTGGVFDGTESVRTSNSDGPRRIFFEPDGTPITAGNFSSTGGKVLQKPDLTAATCVSTSTPGFSIFCGVSSAAPHAAPIGALMLEAAGGPGKLTQAALLTAMKGAALDIEASGVDRDSGAGIVMAPGAVDAVDVAVADRNQAPTVESALDDRTFSLGSAAVTIDLSSVFSDPDNDTLAYSALSSNTARASLSRTGSMLTLTPGAPGTAQVTVRATDPDGLSAVDSFSVSVTLGTRDYDRDDDDLIEVSSLAQLDAIRYDSNGNGVVDDPSDWPSYFAAFTQATQNIGCSSRCVGYELTADLDFDTDSSGGANDGDTYWNGGEGWEPIGGAYQALFEGNGHTIANLFIDRSTESDVGLFSEVGEFGLIRNLGLEAVDVTGKDYVGGLVGDGEEGRVGRSHVTGSVSGEDVVGGLAGSLGRVWSSYAAVRVSATGDGVGGLAGAADIIVVSYATGRVTGGGMHVAAGADCESVGGVGGLVGNVCGAVAASYATGPVSGSAAVGGLAGTGSARFLSSFWDTETSGVRVGFGADDANDNGLIDASESPTIGVAGHTTSELQSPTGYSGIYQHWNRDLDGDGKREDPWQFGTVTQYPALSADTDGGGTATWQELGYQLRSRPTLTVTSTSGQAQVSLSWTAVATNHWSPAPGLNYTLYRDDGATVESLATDLTTRSHTDTDVTLDNTYTYQVAAVVKGGETVRSSWVSVAAGASNQPPAPVGVLADLTLRVGGGTETVTVSGAFRDPESDTLTYGASASATTVATVSTSGAEVTITPVAAGRTTVTVTATDASGSNTAATQRFTVTVWSAAAVDYDSDDDGLIEISSLAQLNAIRHDRGGDGGPTADGKTAYEAAFSDAVDWMGCNDLQGCSGYELTADLDFDTNGNGMADSGDTYWNNGEGWVPIGGEGSTSSGSLFSLQYPYLSIFEGNGHTISHLFIDTDTSVLSGLFGYTFLSNIRNLGLIDVDVDVGSTGLAAGLVAFNSGEIRTSYVTGQVSGKDNVGGLVGINSFVDSSVGEVRGCYASSRVTGEDDVGGLVGDNRGILAASYATGQVSGVTEAGGLVGFNQPDGEIQASYATGPVSGANNAGGLVGLNDGTLTDSYWDTQTSGQTTGSEGRTTAQLQSPTGYSGLYRNWNLDLDGDGTNQSPWHFGTSSQYPVLSVDVDGSDGASWQEFGHQLREGPALTARLESPGVVLTRTAVVTSHWTPAPGVAYTLYRDDGTTVETLAENLSGLSHTDSDVMEGETYTYQVAAVVTDGEAARSARVSLTVPDNTAPMVSTIAMISDPGTDGIYAVNDEIGVTVTFSERVVVRRRPQLTIEVGGEDRTAEYEVGTGTAALEFAYKVEEDDEDTAGVSIAANQLTLNGGTITDRAGNPAVLTHTAVSSQSGHRVDGVRPKLDATDGAVVNGTTLTLTYSEPLDGSSVPPASAFTVTGGGAARTVSGVAVGGRVVILTLDPAVEHGQTGLRVSYRIPTGAGEVPLRDVVGNQADRLSNLPVTNETPDTTPPTVSKLEITSDPGTDRTYAAEDDIQVTVTFSETVEVTGTPRLQIELGGGSRTADYQGGSGTAALVFEYEVADRESDTDGVGVEADSLSGGTIRDEARNNAELDHDGLAADSGHQADGVKPELAATGGAVVDGTTLTLTYSEPLDRSSTPEAGDFTVAGGDRARTVSRVVVRGASVELTLNAGAEHLEVGIQVSYTPGMNPIRDVPGNQAEGLSQVRVTNETPDTTAPKVSSLDISSNPGSDQTYAAEDVIEVRVTLNETVKVTGTPRLRLRVGSRNRPADYLRGMDTATLVFGYEVADGDEDTGGVSIEAGRIALNRGTIEDEAENAAELDHEALATQAGHQVDGVRPSLLSAAVDGSSLTLTYGEALDGGSRPVSGDFTVEVGGSGRSVTGVSISGSVVTMTLNPAVEHGDTGIRVSYSPGARPLRDAVGNDARGLSSRSLTNTTGAPNTVPEITSPSSFDVPENQMVARRLAARDTDPGDEVTGWSIVGGADQSEFSIASDTGELSFRDPPDFEAPGDNQYLVTVEVKSGAGARELEAEQTFTIRVTDEREPPEVPEAPTFSGETADSLEVSWSEPDNTGPDITDYDVQYREKGTGRFIDGDQQGPGLTLTLTDLKPGTVYEVQVRATNDEGTSGWSESGEGMTVAPLTVVMASGTDPPVSGPFTVRFSFSEPVTGFSASDIETGQDPACVDDQNNTVFCDPGIGGLQTADDRVFTTTVTPWTDRVAHSYTLRLTVPGGAVRSSVGSKPNEEPEEPLEVRVSPPGAPEPISSMGLRASVGSGSVSLSWNLPSDNGGSAIIRYEVRYQAVGEAWSEWEKVGAGARGVTVGNLVNGREYIFEVRAVNVLGKGGAETVQATPERRITPPPPPPPPGNGGGGGGLLFPPEAPAGLMAMPGEGAVRLEWGPPESDGGTPILRYEYRLKEGRGEFGEWTPIEDSAPDEVNATGYTVGELGNGTVYVFELRAVNRVGNGRVSEAVEAVMGLDRAYWSNFGAEDLQGVEASLERGPFGGGPQSLRLRFGAGLRFEEDQLDGEGEVTETRMGGYGYRYTSRTTGELRLDYDGGEACELRLTFRGEGAGSYSYRCGGVLGGQGSFRMSGLNRAPEITGAGAYEVAENRAAVGRIEAVDGDDEIEGYGIAGGADGALFAVEAGELMFREAPDYEDPSDVESAEPASGAGDNEYIVVVEVSSGEGERERKGSRAIHVRVGDEEEPPGAPGAPVVTAEGSDSLKVSWREPQNRGPEIVDYEVRYREGGEAGYSDGGHEGRGLEVRLSGLEEGTVYEVQVRAVNQEGMSEWSEPGEGRTDSEEPDPDDPSDFTEGDLEGRRLRLRLEGEEGTEGSLELRFGEGNRFEQIESGGEQAATRAEGASRSGSYTYEKTGPHMGTVSLTYDDGASCEIRLSFTEAGAGTFSYDCGEGDPEEGSFRLTTGSLFVPVILSSAGQKHSFFTSELTLTNRGEQDVRLDYTYTANRGEGSGAASDVLPAGRQRVETDALTYLRGLGIAIPETGNRIGTLRVEARLGSEVEAVVRTTTLVPEGRAGLAYLGVAEEEGFTEAVYLCGLRQNNRDRSNVAFQNMGAPEEGAITVRTTVYSGEAADATARVLEDVTLEPGGFHQYSGLLGVLGVPAQGYVRVERVEGTSPFYAYGVINDQANSDGSFIFPVAASSLEGTAGQTLPVIVETSEFTSELTVTNFSEESRRLDFEFVSEQIKTDDKTAAFSMTLGAGRQQIIPDVVEELRGQVAGLGSSRGFYAGPLFVVAEEGDMSGIVIGARTGSEGGGGQYSVFYNAVPFGEAFSREAWVDGLQQNQENRSNLALVNTGEVDGSASVFHLEIYDGETGLLAETVVTKPIPARRWYQINGILGSYAPETRQGYIRIEKVSGENPFLAYGVVNDGGAPGDRSGDGAYLPARE